MHKAKNNRIQREMDKSKILVRDFESFNNRQSNQEKKINDLNNILKNFDLN